MLKSIKDQSFADAVQVGPKGVTFSEQKEFLVGFFLLIFRIFGITSLERTTRRLISGWSCFIPKQSPEVFYKKIVLKFLKIHRKAPVSEFLF